MENDAMIKPAKIRIEARIGESDDQVARALAEEKGIAIADVYAQAFERGLPILLEESNKMHWWQKSKAEAAFLKLLTAIPDDQLEQAIALLKGLNSPD